MISLQFESAFVSGSSSEFVGESTLELKSAQIALWDRHVLFGSSETVNVHRTEYLLEMFERLWRQAQVHPIDHLAEGVGVTKHLPRHPA
jgi:hypothetical protein